VLGAAVRTETVVTGSTERPLAGSGSTTEAVTDGSRPDTSASSITESPTPESESGPMAPPAGSGINPTVPTTSASSVTESPPMPGSRDDCKDGGWAQLVDDRGQPFADQGACVSFVNHETDQTS